jgi:phosphoribosylamine--glycine ligase
VRVLVVGGGGREHALAWKLAQSSRVESVFAAPGNPGIARIGRCAPIAVSDFEGICRLAEEEGIDLTVVGPEGPLCAGLVDALKARGRRAFGPTKAAARLEGSKIFAKEFMRRHGIPTADFATFDDFATASAHIDERDLHNTFPVVVKADGEAFGKGAVVCGEPAEAHQALRIMMVEKALGPSGERVVIEDCLTGQEVTVMVVCDGESFVPLIPSQDHKAAYDGDQGPNTGGMGCYAPVPAFGPGMEALALENVIEPAIRGMAEEGTPFTGVLYAGLMICEDGLHVLEFNCRFGDPEPQAVLPLMEGDLAELLVCAADGAIGGCKVGWAREAAVCVVMASSGYPGKYEKGYAITGIEEAEQGGAIVFHAGTNAVDGQIVTGGGRVLGVTATGADHAAAISRAYDAVQMIRFDGAHYRRDIGRRALIA